MDGISATWLTTTLMFLLVIGAAFHVSRPNVVKHLKWYREGVIWLLITSAYYPVSVYGILRAFYRDINKTSLRNEWQGLMITTTTLMFVVIAVMLGLVIWSAKRDKGHKWYKEGLVAAISVSICYLQMLMVFIRTH